MEPANAIASHEGAAMKMDIEGSQQSKRNFHHPYTPYPIQIEFMNAVYNCIENEKVGIFESPTGTGKSLSIICGALTWLRDNERRLFEASIVEGINVDDPPWMVEHMRKEKLRAVTERKRELEARLARIRMKEKNERDRYSKGEARQKRSRITEDGNEYTGNDEAQYMLDDYESDAELRTYKPADFDHLSASTRELMTKVGINQEKALQCADSAEDVVQVFYCSRTHSQLTQFVNELRRVNIPTAIDIVEERYKAGISTERFEELKHLSLGSRRTLCINPKVGKLTTTTAINERCLELQQPGTSDAAKCAFLPTQENQSLVNDFRDHAVAKVRDIEDLGKLGQRLRICPYYAARSAVKSSEIVTLPYPLLLQKSAREALNLSLKGHIIIVDEAHNLMDAILNIHSVTVTLSQLSRGRAQLGFYLQKFKNRLKGKNRVYVAQLLRLLDSITNFLERRSDGGVATECIVTPQELMSGKGVDQINVYKLLQYLQQSKLARKVEGYLTYKDQRNAEVQQSSRKSTPANSEVLTPVLIHIQGFLSTLAHPSAEGQFLFSRTESKDLCLRYMLLDPVNHFREIVDDARAVILAGGTMSPMNDYTNHLFSYIGIDKIDTFSCGHVIPASNMVAWPVVRTPSGVILDFTFKNRSSAQLISELGLAILNFCAVIPDGVVVFLPSYSYLDELIQAWQKAQTSGQESTWTRLSRRKRVFQESKESASAEKVLQDFSSAIDSGFGGLLFCVVGGKMSEGINFSDKLGRGVMVVGLPFPNIHGAEWKAKINYVERSAAMRCPEGTNATTKEEIAKFAGREFYENACMRAVNQSIGRAIRHQNDYACILLLDHRYDSERIRGKLPKWIQDGIADDPKTKTFPQILQSLSRFFATKN